MNPISFFMNLSPASRIAACLLAGATPLGILAMFTPGSLFLLLFLVLSFVGMVLLIWKVVLSRLDKAKGKQMERGLKEQASAAPSGAADAASRARMDDLRKSWEEGITKFRERGKDLYSVPWYMMVGESGSGKTEAIRHCNVGFPPGLQDKLQGSGGTMNMHWWFTNQSVILDTAGRLLQDTGRQEWRIFLRMLRKARPLRPINGLLLVIPADSLIKDTGDDLERKGGRIASALDEIQEELGVRFPVYLIITKCDLINGFREYFDAMPDPELKLQEQMLGWSNPDPLDEAFNPAVMDQHLKTIRDRLVQRRYQLLLDPVNTDDPSRRRTEQVDALYAFPDALISLAPRLRRYLEMVFVAGEWSRKPLFIRGIYFTSSMQEGAALDAELAEALGVKIADLQQENVAAKREKTFFLRDVFVSKVFKEQGLVTAAANVKKSQGAQRTLLLGTGFLAALLGLGLTVWSWMGLQGAIGSSSDFWRDASALLGDNFANATVVYQPNPTQAKYQYYGAVPVSQVELPTSPGSSVRLFERGLSTAGDIPLAEVPAQTLQQVVRDRHKRVPFIFRLIASITGGDPFARQKDAHDAVYRGLVLRPVVDAVQRKMIQEAAAPAGGTGEAPAWSDRATAALAQLIRVQASQVDQAAMLLDVGTSAVSGVLPTPSVPGTPGATPAPAPTASGLQAAGQGSLDVASTIRDRGGPVSVDALFRYALEGSDPNSSLTPELLDRQLVSLDDVTARTYRGGDDGAGLNWREAAAAAVSAQTETAIRTGVERFVQDWNARTTGGNSEQLARLTNLRDALQEFDRAEKAMWPSTSLRDVATRAQYRDASMEWRRFYGEVNAANDRINAAIQALGNDVSNLETVSNAARTQLLSSARTAFESLRREIPGGMAGTQVIKPEHSGVLHEMDTRLRAGIAQIETDVGSKVDGILQALQTLRPNLLDRVGAGETAAYAYQLRYRMYRAANERMVAAGSVEDAAPDLTVLELATHLQSADSAAAQARSTVAAAAQDRTSTDAFTSAQRTCSLAIDASLRKTRYDAIAAALRNISDARDIQDLVTQSASREGATRVTIEGLPLTRWTESKSVEDQYNWVGAKSVFDAMRTASLAAAPPAATSEATAPLPRVLEQAEIATLLDRARGVVGNYARDYVDYWTQTLPRALAVQPGQSWSTMYLQIQNIVPREVARSVEANARVFQQALDAVDAGLLGDDADAVRELERGRKTAAYELAERGGNQNNALDLKDNLRNLPQTGKAAREVILPMPVSDFRQRFLFYRIGEEVEIIRYWKSLTYAAFYSIAAESRGAAFEAMQRLRTQHRAFPLCIDESRSLTPQQLQEALGDINAIASVPTGAAAGGGASDSMGNSMTRVGDPELDEVIRNLRGGDFVNPSNREWFNKVRTLATALSPDANGQRLTFDLIILANQPGEPFSNPSDLQSRNPSGGQHAGQNYLYLNVRLGSQRQPWINDDLVNERGGVRTRAPRTCPGLPVPSPEPLQLDFFQREEVASDRLGQSFNLGDSWGGLRAIVLPGAFVASSDQPKVATDWRVPIPIQNMQFWLGIRFSRPIPVPSEWPRSSDWPSE